MPEFGTAKNVMLKIYDVMWAINSGERTSTYLALGSSKKPTTLSLKSIALTKRE